MKKLVLFSIVLAFLAGCSQQQTSDKTTAQDSTTTKNGKELKVNIKANSTNKFLCCDGNHNNNIIGDREKAGEWEEFTLIKKGGDSVSLKAYNGKFVCADMAKNAILIADRDAAGEWETFIMESQKDDKVAFKTSSNKYICCDQKKNNLLVADRDKISDWELFTIIYK